MKTRMYLDADGTLNAIGMVFTYPYECPEFILASNHLRWKCNNTSDINNPASWEELPIVYDGYEMQEIILP